MILADTSVWVEHLRRGSVRLQALLEDGAVACHPFVLGELACGNLQRREAVLGLLAALPQARLATHEEALHLVQSRRLHGRGLGWVDAHLLASAALERYPLWTLDRPLERACADLGLAMP